MLHRPLVCFSFPDDTGELTELEVYQERQRICHEYFKERRSSGADGSGGDEDRKDQNWRESVVGSDRYSPLFKDTNGSDVASAADGDGTAAPPCEFSSYVILPFALLAVIGVLFTICLNSVFFDVAYVKERKFYAANSPEAIEARLTEGPLDPEDPAVEERAEALGKMYASMDPMSDTEASLAYRDRGISGTMKDLNTIESLNTLADT